MTSALFLLFVAIVAGAVIALMAIRLPGRMAAPLAAALVAWLIYVGTLALNGVLGDAALKPPGPVFILAPILIYLIVFVAGSEKALLIATSFPPAALILLQSFRIVVELFFYQLWIDGLAPRMLTFEGANFDILTGLTAPLAAWAATRGPVGRRVGFVWNILGLLILVNVAIRAVLSSPGPLNVIHTEVPNLSIGVFPFSYIAGFLAPLAATLHILTFRSLANDRRRPRDLPNIHTEDA
jgi:hypothetical protein